MVDLLNNQFSNYVSGFLLQRLHPGVVEYSSLLFLLDFLLNYYKLTILHMSMSTFTVMHFHCN